MGILSVETIHFIYINIIAIGHKQLGYGIEGERLHKDQ